MVFVNIPQSTVHSTVPNLFLEFLMYLKIGNITITDFAFLLRRIETNNAYSFEDYILRKDFDNIREIYTKIQRDFKKHHRTGIRLDIDTVHQGKISILGEKGKRELYYARRDPIYTRVKGEKTLSWDQPEAAWVVDIELSSALKKMKASLIIKH